MQDHTALDRLQPAKTQRASELIYVQLRDMILGGELLPGDRLPSERSLMDRLHRSRPTVREALRMLETDGFIQIVPGSQGAIVQELTTKNVEQSLQLLLKASHISLEQLAEMRSNTDVAVARWAAERRTEADLLELDAQLRKQQESLDDYSVLAHLDPAFHTALGHAARNEVAVIFSQVFSRLVEDILDSRMARAGEFRRNAMARKIVYMHTQIVEAIRRQNAEQAAALMQEHVTAFLSDLAEAPLDMESAPGSIMPNNSEC